MYIKGEITKENIEAMVINTFETTGKMKSHLNNLAVLTGALLLIILFMVKPSFEPVQFSIYIIISILVGMLVPVIIKKVLIRKLNQKDQPDESECFTWNVTEKGIHEKKESGNMFLEWDKVEKITSDKKNFFLYYREGPVIILPKETNVSEDQLYETLSTYIAPSKMESILKAGKRGLLKRKITFILLTVLVLLIVVRLFFIHPQDEVKIAEKEVNALFVEEEVVKHWKIDEEVMHEIKDSTEQQQIDQASKAISNIDSNQITEDNYMLIFGMKMLILEAQEQLNKVTHESD